VFVKWLAGALLIDAFIISISIAFPGSEDITYHRFGERQWVTFVSVIKLTMIATLSLSCFTVWVKGDVPYYRDDPVLRIRSNPISKFN
jgi:hypothetical protein